MPYFDFDNTAVAIVSGSAILAGDYGCTSLIDPVTNRVWVKCPSSSSYNYTFYYSDDNGATWSGPETITHSYTISRGIFLDNDGKLVFVVASTVNGDQTFYRREGIDGAPNWTAIGSTYSTYSQNFGIVFAQEPVSGDWYATRKLSSPADNVYVKRSTDNLVTWSSPVDLGAFYGAHTVLIPDGLGAMFLVIASHYPDGKISVFKTTDGTWSLVDDLTPTLPSSHTFLRLAAILSVDKTTLHIFAFSYDHLGADSSEDGIQYFTLIVDGGTIVHHGEITGLVSPNLLQYLSASISQDDVIHLTYQLYSDSLVRYQRSEDNGATWSPPETIADGSGGTLVGTRTQQVFCEGSSLRPISGSGFVTVGYVYPYDGNKSVYFIASNDYSLGDPDPIPALATAQRGASLTPVLSIYYTGDTPDIQVTSDSIVLTEGAQTVTINTAGLSTCEVVAALNRTRIPAYFAVAMSDIDDVGALLLTLTEGDLTNDGGQIIRVNCHIVKKLEESQIHLLPPYNDSRYSPWNVVINKGYVTRRWRGGDWIFAIPEYEDQTWSTLHGRTYMDINDELAERTGPSSIRVSRTPLLWEKNNIFIAVHNVDQSSVIIRDVDVNNGVIYLDRTYPESDNIYVSYTYKEAGYIYPDVNLNPTEFHNPGILNRYILIYLLPYIGPDGVLRSRCVRYVEGSTLAGAVNSIPDVGEPVMILGAIQIRPSQSVGDIQLIDTRTHGGGVDLTKWEEALSANRESLSIADKGFYFGRPYGGNQAFFMTLPKELLQTFTRTEIDGIVKRFVAYGSYVFLEYE